MKKYLIAGIAVLSAGIVAGVIGYSILFGKELDDVAENGPIHSQIIAKQGQVPLFADMLAAGISWDYDRDRFLISTDQPHSLLPKKTASFYVVNAGLDAILYQKDLKTDGDLEGIAYIGNGEVALISEAGTLYYLKESGKEWTETARASIFDDQGKHKLGSLAYDPVHQQLYSAEKEGKKTIYQISRSGQLQKHWELKLGSLRTKRDFDLSQDYTIAGMTFDTGHLYIFSEAYSTIFQYNLAAREVSRVYGVSKIHESAGITLKQGTAYLVGDFERYLPAPSFYLVDLPG